MDRFPCRFLRREFAGAVLAVVFLFSVFPTFAGSQTYLNAIGQPTFTTALPAEMGFVNIANGNLHLVVPITSAPQRGARSFSAFLVYDSRIWQVVNNGTSNTWQPTNVPNSWGGWRFATSVDPGTVSYSLTTTTCSGTQVVNTWQNFVWTQPDGTQRAFPITTTQNQCTGVNTASTDAYASDSSGFHMYITNFTTATIFAKDGTQVYPSVKDTNGNYFSTDANGNVIDTLGRTQVTKTVNGNAITLAVLNSQGSTSNYTITTESINVNTAFGRVGTTEYSGTITAVQSITLPDNSKYSFTYDSGTTPGNYGLLASMTVREGGQITYAYTNFADSYGNINRWLNTRTLAGGTWTYAPQVLTTCAAGQTGCQQQVTFTKPSGDQFVYTFTLNNGAWSTQTLFYNGSSATGTLLKTVNTDFDFSNACPLAGCSGAAYVRPIRVTTIDPIPGSSISKKTELSYDSIYYGNLAAVKE